MGLVREGVEKCPLGKVETVVEKATLSGKGAGKNSAKAKARAAEALPDEQYAELLSAARAFEKPKAGGDSRVRETAIVDALLARGANVSEAVRWCIEHGVKTSERFVGMRKKAAAGAGDGMGNGNPPSGDVPEEKKSPGSGGRRGRTGGGFEE
jgi:hypothetical protein